MALLDTSSSDTPGDYPPGLPLITTQALTKKYGSVVALDDLDLTLEPGLIGLVGANGAGKSTLIKILLGLLPPTSGSASMFDLDVATHGLEIRRRIGYMPEHDCLPLDISATEFVAHMAQVNGLPRGSARERTAETLRHVGLFEERYREMRGYSTGMRQRVKLAQALVHDPQLMLLDEPTNGLDPAGRDEMLDLVRRIGTEFGISILMSSHLLTEIERVCEHLVVIEGGDFMASALDPTPAFLKYRHHIGVISGIEWQESPAFPTKEEYTKQFTLFESATPKGGTLIYFDLEPVIAALGKVNQADVQYIAYKTHLGQTEDGKEFLLSSAKEKYALKITGKHNFQNISAAKEVLKKIGISSEMFYQAIPSFGSNSI